MRLGPPVHRPGDIVRVGQGFRFRYNWRPPQAPPGFRFQLFRFPFANHLQDGLFVGLGNDSQLKYPSRDRVADPVPWTPYGPYFYMPTGFFRVPPAGHLVAAQSATTGHFTSHACLPRSLSPVCLHIVCFNSSRNRKPRQHQSRRWSCHLICCASSDDWHGHSLAFGRLSS
jgi:hypothetical protein